MKNFIFVFIFKFINNILLYKLLLESCNSVKIQTNVNLVKKPIQKGYKSKKLGIYLRNFFKNKNNFISNKQKFFYFLMRFKRKNLFLTLLNIDGNVLCKTNIGSCGFKKKVKFTGYAIKRTSKTFYEKISKALVKNIYFFNKAFEKNKYRIKELILLKKNLIFNKKNNKKNIKRKKINKNRLKNKVLKNKKTLLYFNKINNKRIVRTTLLSKKVFKSFIDYRNYPHFTKILKNSLRIILRIKSNLKF